ncbi:MAG: hypothetical protein JRN39_06190 [Nitrososphaerota archaeon]|nr:hypothetical protein [Nitrososphaerota archaeon]
MLFDEAPKTDRSDLYDFREEQGGFLRALKEGARLVTIVGLRRTGKSSLLLTGPSGTDQPSLIIEARGFAQSPVITRADFFSAFERVLNEFIASQTKWSGRILDALKSIRGVEVSSGPPSLFLGADFVRRQPTCPGCSHRSARWQKVIRPDS